eukprot:6182068-Pleurochrysis_carterae.AAC.1
MSLKACAVLRHHLRRQDVHGPAEGCESAPASVLALRSGQRRCQCSRSACCAATAQPGVVQRSVGAGVEARSRRIPEQVRKTAFGVKRRAERHCPKGSEVAGA